MLGLEWPVVVEFRVSQGAVKSHQRTEGKGLTSLAVRKIQTLAFAVWRR